MLHERLRWRIAALQTSSGDPVPVLEKQCYQVTDHDPVDHCGERPAWGLVLELISQSSRSSIRQHDMPVPPAAEGAADLPILKEMRWFVGRVLGLPLAPERSPAELDECSRSHLQARGCYRGRERRPTME